MSVGKSRFATGADVVAMLVGMRTAFAVFLCLAVVGGSELSARSTRDKAHAAEVLKAPKDDAKTKKDKVIRALDKFPKKKVRTKAKDWRTRVPAPPWQKSTQSSRMATRVMPSATCVAWPA
jgi:hypothetical protein